jgi:hypothetical protein
MAKQEKTLRDGNGRAARLARWLDQKPALESVDQLVLELKTSDGEWARLQVWPRNNVSQFLATDIDATVQDAANEQGQYITARCAWFDSSAESYWTEHQLRVHPEGMGEQQAFDGTAQSQAILMQRHQERALGMGLNTVNLALQAMREAMELSRDTATQAQSELLALRERNAELEGENARLAGMLDQALTAAETARAEREEESEQSNVIRLIQNAITTPAPSAITPGK